MGKPIPTASESNNKVEKDEVISSVSGGVIPEAPAPAPVSKPASSGKGLDMELTEEPKRPAAPPKRPSLEPMMSDSGAPHKPAAQHSSREMKPRYPAPEGVTPRKPRTEPMQGGK